MTISDSTYTGEYGGIWFIWILIIFALMGGGNGMWGNGSNTQQMAADLSAAKTQANIWQSNDQQNLMSAIGQVRDGNISLGNGIADATFALNNTMVSGFNSAQRDVLQGNFAVQQDILGTGNNIAQQIMQTGNANQVQNMQNANMIAQAVNENRFAGQQGFTGVNTAIQGVNYENAMNTCRITTNSTDNTQKILDKLSNMEMNAKDAEIANLRQQLANAQLAVSQYDQNATLVAAIRPFPTPSYTVSSPYTSTSGSCPYA